MPSNFNKKHTNNFLLYLYTVFNVSHAVFTHLIIAKHTPFWVINSLFDATRQTSSSNITMWTAKDYDPYDTNQTAVHTIIGLMAEHHKINSGMRRNKTLIINHSQHIQSQNNGILM